MLEIRGIWLCHMSRWVRYVLRPRVRAETSGSKTVPHIGPYNTPHVRCFPRVFGAWPCLLRQVGTALGSPYDLVVTGIEYEYSGSRHMGCGDMGHWRGLHHTHVVVLLDSRFRSFLFCCSAGSEP